jgi:anti-sigma B factor antagonist
MALWIEVDQREASTLLVLRGELDVSTAPKLREALVDAIGSGRRIVVDLEGLEFLDSVGLGILVSGLKRARTHEGDLVVVCASRTILRPFELTGLDEVITIHERREQALG